MNINYTSFNTFIFSFVRMNPPTPGHLELIKQMIYKAVELNVNQIYVILSSSLDGLNPLPCDNETIPSKQTNYFDNTNIVFKSTILYEMVNNYKQILINQQPDEELKGLISKVNINIFCSQGNPFAFINNNILMPHFINKGITDINIYFVVGRDRADFFDRIMIFFKENKNVKSFDGKILERTGMSEALASNEPNSISKSAMSASYVRKKVNNNLKNDFDNIYKDYLSQESINKLFYGIRHGLAIPFKAKRSSSGMPRSIYYDSEKKILPLILPNETQNEKTLNMAIKKPRILYGGSKKKKYKKKTKVKKKHYKRQKTRRRQRTVKLK